MPKVGEPIKPKKTVPARKSNPLLLMDASERIEYAADQEGMWCHDILKFPDLRKKYLIPETAGDATADRAHAIQRRKIAETMKKAKQSGRYQEFS